MLPAIPFAGYACNCSPKREQSVQRDLDLFRDMLLQIERSPHSVHWYEIAIPGRSREQLSYHAKLAADAGLIEARFLSGTPIFTVHRLTNDGHEFLDAARETATWNRAKQMALHTAGSLTVAALRVALAVIVQQAVTGTLSQLPPGHGAPSAS